jgi:hypothetical protein
MVENNDNIQQRDVNNNRRYAFVRGLRRENRRKRSKKLGSERRDGKRKSKDEMENAEGKRLLEWSEKNGNKQGDEEEEWTYISSKGKQ